MAEITDWWPLGLRLFLSLIAGFLIGFNRGEHGEPAGLRTTTLVCLAASIAMILANLLLGTTGRPADSYVTFDVMRLPLGILTGVGFLGAGAIFRQDNLLRGVTTAATLWFVTVIGLCLGSGQIGLGVIGTAIGLAVLWGMKAIERLMWEEKSASLIIVTKPDGLAPEEVRKRLQRSKLKIADFGETIVNGKDGQHTMELKVRWRAPRHDTDVPLAVADLAQADGVERLQWKPQLG